MLIGLCHNPPWTKAGSLPISTWGQSSHHKKLGNHPIGDDQRRRDSSGFSSLLLCYGLHMLSLAAWARLDRIPLIVHDRSCQPRQSRSGFHVVHRRTATLSAAATAGGILD
jgi:hypothetical protein